MNIRLHMFDFSTRSPRLFRVAGAAATYFKPIPALAILLFCCTAVHAQASRDVVGRVEGHDFTVENAPGISPLANELAGTLTSGARLIVRSGQARIFLQGGGDVVICGAAELQVLKSQGSLTIALDYGTLRVHVNKSDPVSVFTPLVLATTIEIGNGERDITVGLEQTGQMCVRAKSGAVRVAQQLSGESLLVPQFGGLSLSGGQINAVSSSAPGCTCDADAAKLAPLRVNAAAPPLTATAPPVAPAAAPTAARVPEVIQQNLIATPRPQVLSSSRNSAPPSLPDPVMTVISPALVFNASNPEPPPDPGADVSLLVSSIRVREETVYRGTVRAKENRSADYTATQTSAVTPVEHPGVFSRIGGFFRRLFGGSS